MMQTIDEFFRAMPSVFVVICCVVAVAWIVMWFLVPFSLYALQKHVHRIANELERHRRGK